MSNTTQSISSITISGNSIIDFGGSSASLNLNSLVVTAGTLTIRNWTGDPGDFYVNNTVDPTSVSNVIFEGWGGATWDPIDGVTPNVVPEPSHYGAGLIGLLSIIMIGRRKSRVSMPDRRVCR